MHSFSHSVNYAFRSMALLEGPPGDLRLVGDLSARTGAPRPFLGKVLQVLQKAGLVQSVRGRNGGFRLTRPAGEIHLAEVVDVLDGPEWRSSCLLGIGECTGRVDCAAWTCCREVRERMTAELTRLTVGDLGRFLPGGASL